MLFNGEVPTYRESKYMRIVKDNLPLCDGIKVASVKYRRQEALRFRDYQDIKEISFPLRKDPAREYVKYLRYKVLPKTRLGDPRLEVDSIPLLLQVKPRSIKLLVNKRYLTLQSAKRVFKRSLIYIMYIPSFLRKVKKWYRYRYRRRFDKYAKKQNKGGGK
jgi:hypothetical protein